MKSIFYYYIVTGNVISYSGTHFTLSLLHVCVEIVQKII